MAPRNKRTRNYAFASTSYLASQDPFKDLLAEAEAGRTLEQIKSDWALPKHGVRTRLVRVVCEKVRDAVVASDLDHMMKQIVLLFVLPLLTPTTPEVSPTRNGACVAETLEEEIEPAIPEATPMTFDDTKLKKIAKSAFKPVKAFLPPIVPEVIEVLQAAKESTTLVEKRSRPESCVPENHSEKKSDNTKTPRMNLVAPCFDTGLFLSDLTHDVTWTTHFAYNKDEVSVDDMDDRHNFWGLHTTSCLPCNWIARFAWPARTYTEGPNQADRLRILILHAWGHKRGEIEYSRMCKVMLDHGMITLDNRVVVKKFLNYVESG